MTVVLEVVAAVLERVPDDREGAPLVVPRQVLDVLEEQDGRGRWSLVDEPDDLEEEVPALLVLEPMFAPEAELLRHPGEAERLAREAGGEDVVPAEGR